VYFQQYYLSCLAHASYLIGSEGLAAVVDPQRDVQVYLDDAEKQGLRITHVIETHMHADFVSGHQELAARLRAACRSGDLVLLKGSRGAAMEEVLRLLGAVEPRP